MEIITPFYSIDLYVRLFCLVAAERTRYYQESREGIYTGPLFILANFLQGLPLSALSTLLATFITFRSSWVIDMITILGNFRQF
jgi:hypothetical protein